MTKPAKSATPYRTLTQPCLACLIWSNKPLFSECYVIMEDPVHFVVYATGSKYKVDNNVVKWQNGAQIMKHKIQMNDFVYTGPGGRPVTRDHGCWPRDQT